MRDVSTVWVEAWAQLLAQVERTQAQMPQHSQDQNEATLRDGADMLGVDLTDAAQRRAVALGAILAQPAGGPLVAGAIAAALTRWGRL